MFEFGSKVQPSWSSLSWLKLSLYVSSSAQGLWTGIYPGTCPLAGAKQRGRVSQDQGAHQKGVYFVLELSTSTERFFTLESVLESWKLLRNCRSVLLCFRTCFSRQNVIGTSFIWTPSVYTLLILRPYVNVFPHSMLFYCTSFPELWAERREGSVSNYERSVEEVEQAVSTQHPPPAAAEPHEVPLSQLLPGQAPSVRNLLG